MFIQSQTVPRDLARCSEEAGSAINSDFNSGFENRRDTHCWKHCTLVENKRHTHCNICWPIFLHKFPPTWIFSQESFATQQHPNIGQRIGLSINRHQQSSDDVLSNIAFRYFKYCIPIFQILHSDIRNLKNIVSFTRYDRLNEKCRDKFLQIVNVSFWVKM